MDERPFLQCKCCKGKGEKRKAADWFLAPFSLGASLILGNTACPCCNGTGWVKNPNFIQKEKYL